MSSASRGSHLERTVKERLEQAGYYVIRAAGSHGEADLIALRFDRTPLMVQCKCRDGKLRPPEWNALYAAATLAGADALVAYRGTPREITLMRLTGVRQPHSRTWPWVEWVAERDAVSVGEAIDAACAPTIVQVV